MMMQTCDLFPSEFEAVVNRCAKKFLSELKTASITIDDLQIFVAGYWSNMQSTRGLILSDGDVADFEDKFTEHCAAAGITVSFE